jgi:hypothetical protein
VTVNAEPTPYDDRAAAIHSDPIEQILPRLFS